MGLIHSYRTVARGRQSRRRAKRPAKVGTGGKHNEGAGRQVDDTGNVVRIPRDWFGPPEELVPFGPSAERPAESLGVGERGRSLAEPADRADRSLDPNSFWDESSSSIQDVVEAPAGLEDAAGGGGVLAVLPRRLRFVDALGVRALAASAAVALIVAVSLVGWLLGGSPHRPSRSAAASIQADRPPEAAPRVDRASAGLAVGSTGGVRGTPRVRTRATTTGHELSAPVTRVVYRSTQPSYPPPPQVSSATQSSPVETSSSSGGVGASSARASQSSPPAFGSNGALGPMSSPDG